MSNLLSKASILLTPTATSDGKLHNIKPNTTTGDFDFTRATTATRVNSSGLIESVASGLPRIDFTGGTGQVLLEPASTNLITLSQNLAVASGSYSSQNNATTTPSSLPSPDGGTNAFSFIYDGTFNASIKKQTAISADQVVTFSVFIKKTADTPTFSADSNIKIGIFGNVVSSVGLNLGNALNAATIGEWVRYSITATADSDGGNTNPNIRCDVAAQIDVFGWQLETNSFATSYIPTSGSTVTRNADEANNAGDTSLINSTEGVLYAEVSPTGNTSAFRLISLIDPTDNTNRLDIGFTNTNKIYANVRTSGSSKINSTSINYNIDQYYKLVIKWSNTSGCSFYIDGIEIATGANTSFSASDFTSLNFKNIFDNPMNGKVKCVAVFKEALTDAQLISLTS